MANVCTPQPNPSRRWRVRFASWVTWVVSGRTGLRALTVTPQDNGETLLSGQVADQSALHGLLNRVRDLGLPLLSVVCVKASQAESAKVNEGHQARSEEEN
jgi:hypothetical protein